MASVRYLCPICLGVCTLYGGYTKGGRRSFVCEVHGGRYIYCGRITSCESCDEFKTCSEYVAIIRGTADKQIEELVGSENRWCRPNYKRERLEI